VKFDDALKAGLITAKNDVVEKTGRVGPCFICQQRTDWHQVYPDMPSVPICSDECLGTSMDQDREVAEAAKTAA
jgi:hypothetical protein